MDDSLGYGTRGRVWDKFDHLSREVQFNYGNPGKMSSGFDRGLWSRERNEEDLDLMYILEVLECGEFAPIFQANGISTPDFFLLSEADLR